MIRQLDSDIWVVERPLRYLGAEVGTRMTVIELDDGSLFVHSPVRLDLKTQHGLNQLGRVRFVVAPNRFHHLFVADYPRAYPEALLFGAPGLDSKRKDLKFDATLGDEPPSHWAGHIEQLVFHAFRPLNEVVFFHASSGTVLFTDLLFNVTRSSSAYTRTLLKLDGGYGGVAVPRTFRLGIRLNRAKARQAIGRILDWDFDRLIVAHGEVIESGAKEKVRAAWSFL
jgi:hypothetical protein